MAEIPFEIIALAPEAQRGTGVTPPTHYLNMAGTLTPRQERWRPEESRGTLAEYNRSVVTRRWGEWEAEGGLDPNTMPLLANMALKAVGSPTTPSGATNTRLWTFARDMTSDTLKSASMYFGDPNVKLWLGLFGMMDELAISADGTGTDGTTVSANGRTQFPEQLESNPTLPAQNNGPLIVPGDMEIWLDPTSAFGTTKIEGRVLSVEHTIPTGVTYKFLPQGPDGNRTYTRTGRQKTHPETRLTLELLDMDQYQLFEDGEPVKLRVRHNGPEIETVGETTFRSFVEVDAYGPLDFNDWGEFETSNRTLELAILHEYNSTMGTDLIMRIQNARTTL